MTANKAVKFCSDTTLIMHVRIVIKDPSYRFNEQCTYTLAQRKHDTFRLQEGTQQVNDRVDERLYRGAAADCMMTESSDGQHYTHPLLCHCQLALRTCTAPVISRQSYTNNGEHKYTQTSL